MTSSMTYIPRHKYLMQLQLMQLQILTRYATAHLPGMQLQDVQLQIFFY